MIKTTLTAISALVLVAAATNLARADSLNDVLGQPDLAAICATLEVGAEISGSFLLLDGSTVTGKVECEAKDLVPGADDSSELLSVEGDDDSGLSTDDDGEDDNGGLNSGSGGDDDGEDSGDDNSGTGGGDDE